MKLKKIREKFKFKDTSLYLVVGMICVLTYSFFLPLFTGPDDFYHFDCSTYISNIVVDRSYISSKDTGYPSYIQESMKDRNYINDLFFNKVKIINRQDVIDKRAKLQKGYEFWGHLIPAIGIKLGYLLYPSVGIMFIFSRIFSGVVYLLCMYFIIKKLKYGKRLFMAVSLTPTMLPIMASLNYDGLNFVVISFFLMAFINLSVESKFSMRNLLKLLIGILFILFFAKTNMLLMLTLVPILFLNSWKKIPLYQKIKSKLKNIKMFYILISFLLVIVLSAFFIIKIDVNTIIRIFNTLTYPENTFMTSMILGGNFVFVPSLFLSYYWFFVIVVSILSDKSKFVLKNSIFSWTPFFLYVLHIFIALICYRSYLWHAKTNFLSKVIEGQQGRYFTPYILPFSILGASLNRRIKISDLMLNLFIFGGSVMSVIFTIYAIYIF